MKITVVKEFTFDSAHFLPGYDGPCAELHGHTYRLQVGFKGTPNPETGMVMDFGRFKKIVNECIVFHLDHRCLNTVDYKGFPWEMPTAENMVIWMRKEMLGQMSIQQSFYLCYIRLWETPTSYAEWRA